MLLFALGALVYAIFIACLLFLVAQNMRLGPWAWKLVFGALLVDVALGHVVIIFRLSMLPAQAALVMIVTGIAGIAISASARGTYGLITNPRIGQYLGLLAFILAIASMLYFMFGPTVGVADSSGRSYTASYWSVDPGVIRIVLAIWAAALLGAVFAWAKMKLLVLIIGLLFLGFSLLAAFSIGPLTVLVAICFLASAIALPREGYSLESSASP